MSRCIAALLTLATFCLHAGDSPRDRATLKGVKSIAIVIDTLPADLSKEGVTPENLRARLMDRLREASIPIDDTAKEFLGVRLASVRDTRGPYAVCVMLGFYQPATLTRDPAVRFAPQTWDTDLVLMAAPKVVPRAVLESIDELANRFIAAWRAANP